MEAPQCTCCYGQAQPRTSTNLACAAQGVCRSTPYILAALSATRGGVVAGAGN